MRIAIIGAGAAGCFAAANLSAHAGSEIVVFEKTGKAMQKVKASGGGRCNVTHACFDIPSLTERYPRGRPLLRKTLYRFGPEATIQWFRERGVMLKTEQDGRMFPVTDNSQTIIDCIWQEMMKHEVAIRYHKQLSEIEKKADGFTLHFADGTAYLADAVLIACGGYPKPEQYAWLSKLGHTIIPPVPSLFTFNMPKNPITRLMGVSVPEVTLKVTGTKISEKGPLLITHWGMSGPVVLRTSAWAARQLNECGYDFRIQINWLQDVDDSIYKQEVTQMRQNHGKTMVYNKNPFPIPKRLWEYQLQQCGVMESTRWGELPATQQNKLMESLLRDAYDVKGKTTFKEEFVTCGGISLADINPGTMESRIVPGVYFAGELVDVDGITGGFNFQHAWASAYIAAEELSKLQHGQNG